MLYYGSRHEVDIVSFTNDTHPTLNAFYSLNACKYMEKSPSCIDTDLLTNYRPISLLPSISKVFEKSIFNKLHSYFKSNNLYFSSQYGLRELHSTEFAALELTDKFIFEMDADFSHNPQDVPKMELHLLADADVVIGSRYVDGINVVNWPLGRILLSLAASYYVKFFTSLPVKDATAGFVGYKAEVLRAIDLDAVKFVGYAFQIELKYKAWKKGFKLKEYSIIFLNRAKGQSKMNGSIIWEAIYGVVFLRIQSLFKRKQ